MDLLPALQCGLDELSSRSRVADAHHALWAATSLPAASQRPCQRALVGRWRGARGAGPFPAAPSPNDACDFHRTSLSGDYCVASGVGRPEWMRSWQERQTTRVLRRRRAISCAHSGRCCPGRSRSASLRTWCTEMPSVALQSSHRSARSRLTSSLWRMMPGTRTRSEMTVFFCLLSGMPPNRATSGFLPLRSTLASIHLRGPCGVSMTALNLRAIFDTVERCLFARVLSSEVSMTQCSR